jgi:pimeloyl-ACP methyl ester carboxylesterase
VLSLDRRGHGLSDRPDSGATMARHGQDLASFLDQLDLTRVVLVGGSMGGNTIWAYVESFGTERIRAIVIVDQTPKMLNDDDWAYGFYDYSAANRDTLFAETVPNPGRVSLASKGPPAHRQDPAGARRRRAKRADRAREAAAERPRDGGLAADDRADIGAGALRGRKGERLLALGARGRIRCPRAARLRGDPRAGRPRGQHRAGAPLQPSAAALPAGALNRLLTGASRTPCNRWLRSAAGASRNQTPPTREAPPGCCRGTCWLRDVRFADSPTSGWEARWAGRRPQAGNAFPGFRMPRGSSAALIARCI